MDEFEINEFASNMEPRRKYASFFEYNCKSTKEFGVGLQLIESLNAKWNLGLHDLQSSLNDPPDLTWRSHENDLVAVEITELVSEEAIKANEKGNDVYRAWSPSEVCNAIEKLLQRKDQRKLRGDPFKGYIVALHTDEMMICTKEMLTSISQMKFGSYRQITEAFLLASYDPIENGYPLVKLQTERMPLAAR